MLQDPEEAQTSEVEPSAEIEDIETLKQVLAEEKAKAEGYLANWQRAQADLINYKRRAEQEKGEIAKFANTTFILSLLPALDDIERAFASIPPDLAELNWVDGIRLIERKLRAILEAMGVSEIEAIGEPFDPNLHEAVRQTEGDEGMVIEGLEEIVKTKSPRMIYLVPTFQNPDGRTIPESRRRYILDLASEYQIPVIEDDPYSELYFEEIVPKHMISMSPELYGMSYFAVKLTTASHTISPGSFPNEIYLC